VARRVPGRRGQSWMATEVFRCAVRLCAVDLPFCAYSGASLPDEAISWKPYYSAFKFDANRQNMSDGENTGMGAAGNLLVRGSSSHNSSHAHNASEARRTQSGIDNIGQSLEESRSVFDTTTRQRDKRSTRRRSRHLLFPAALSRLFPCKRLPRRLERCLWFCCVDQVESVLQSLVSM
jgi:hypothetical protein